MPGLYTGATGLWGGFAGLLYGSSALSTPPGLLADAGGFTPASLFAQGEQGVWYDPSDFSTLFQNSSGTTPVTAVEQPVGLMLDKSGRGNHATQSSDASRPVLSARVNLLTYSEQFDNAAWSRAGLLAFGSGSVANTTATTDPLGGNTADLLTEDTATGGHSFAQTSLQTAAGTYTAKVYAKSNGRNLNIWLRDGSGGVVVEAFFNLSTGTATVSGMLLQAGWTSPIASIQAAGNGWYLCSLTATSSGTAAKTFNARLNNGTGSFPSYTGDGTSGIYIWGADLRPTNQTTGTPTYQRIAAATDYDTVGFPVYLRLDGSDDWMVTGTIDPGSVDKAQVFAGVRKLSDAAVGTVCELSATDSGNNGMFAMFAPLTGASFSFRSKGTTSRTVEVFSNAAPITRVVTGIGDISGDMVTLRLDAAEAGTSTLDQGTGNYLSYPLYIGSRGGTTLRFNGQLYSLIARFSATNLPDATIAQTEAWVNGKTGAY